MLCAIWCHLCDLKNVKNTHGGVLLFAKLQAACILTKSNTHPWVFFTFLKLHKWHLIVQRTTYIPHFFALFQICQECLYMTPITFFEALGSSMKKIGLDFSPCRNSVWRMGQAHSEISLAILGEIKRINFYYHLELSENHRISEDFKENKS